MKNYLILIALAALLGYGIYLGAYAYKVIKATQHLQQQVDDNAPEPPRSWRL